MVQDSNGSGILEEALKISKCSKKRASHFVFCRGQKIKYIIHTGKTSKQHLLRTVTPYNKKLDLLLHLLPIIPLSFLRLVGLGYFAQVTPHPSIKNSIPEGSNWNILVGTYDQAQKIVLQCFTPAQKNSTFIKVGNRGSAKQMEREIHFLKNNKKFQSFEIPRLKQSNLISDDIPFNILITDEFNGQKVPPILTQDILRITKEIAGENIIINEASYTFSHGDFAPWNLRQRKDRFTVFDWEHCGLRPAGYDLVYFIIMPEIALHKRNFDAAFDTAIQQIRQFDSEISIDKQLIRQEFAKTTKTLHF